jgi:MoaA/NifB/PqqE/SkfB family radical SAM enzyme
MSQLVDKESCGISYSIDPNSASDIYLDKHTVEHVINSNHELSVSGISLYLRTLQPEFSPILLIWDMTSKCNFNCEFCYIKDNDTNEEITFEKAKKLIDDLVSLGLYEVYLSGGECLLIDDFTQIYTYLKQKGLFVTVFTNGSLIYEDIIACWRKYPPSSVEITLYTNDFSSKPFVNVLKLKEMGIHVVTKFTLTSTTIDYYDDIKKWCDDHSFNLVIDSEIFDGKDSKHQNIANTYSINDDLKLKLDSTRYINFESEPKVRKGLECKAKHGIVQISPDFSMSLCYKMDKRYDLNKMSVPSIISKLQALITKYEHAKIHGCSGCIYHKKCDMCLANATVIDDELYVPDGFCKRIKQKYEPLLFENGRI